MHLACLPVEALLNLDQRHWNGFVFKGHDAWLPANLLLQVAARLAAAGHTRSLWPLAARQEVEAAEQQVHTLQEQLQQVQQQLQDAMQQLQDGLQAQALLKHQLAIADSRLNEVS